MVFWLLASFFLFTFFFFSYIYIFKLCILCIEKIQVIGSVWIKMEAAARTAGSEMWGCAARWGSMLPTWVQALCQGSLLPTHPCCGMGSPDCIQAGNSLSSCRGCNGKRKNLLVSISFISDWCISFLSLKKTLHPGKSPCVESCCVSGSPGHTAASYLPGQLCETSVW